MKPRILLARRLPPEAEAEAARRFDVVPSGPDDLDTPAALAILRDSGAAGMVLANNVLLDAATIAALPETFRIAASATVGLDHVNVAAASRRGIVVTNTPGVLEDCTADYAFMLLLMAARRAKDHMALIADGWSRPLAMDEALGTRLRQAPRHRRHGRHRPGDGRARPWLRHVSPLSQPSAASGRPGGRRHVSREPLRPHRRR